MNKYLLFTFLLVQLALFDYKILACTSYLVSRGASADGSTMVSYAADSHIRYGELYWRPAAKWPAGTMVTLYDRGTAKPLGKIPQVSQTYQVIGFMNEHQVAIGESTFDGRKELKDSTGIVDYGSLMFLALQRSKTAREAIKVIAELVDMYGYASTGESFSIGDPNGVWYMELIGKGTLLKTDRKTKKQYNVNKGAVWVAIRIPEGYISAHANQARITTFPLEDGIKSITNKNFGKIHNPNLEVMYSHDVITFARSQGYFNGTDGEFSFSDTYAPMSFDAARFCELRVWSMFKSVSGEMDQFLNYAMGEKDSPRMPLFIKPDRKLTPRDLMEFKRDFLSGTDMDMSKDIGSGPYNSPYRWRPLTWKLGNNEYFHERVTVTQQTGFSFIAQMRNWLPNPIGGILWFGVDDAGSAVYVPFYCGINKVPHNWAEGNGDMLLYNDDAAFWIFNRVAHFKYLFFNRVIVDIKKAQNELESKFEAYLPGIDNAALTFWELNPGLARSFLTDYSIAMANETILKWKELSNFLLVKYLDGNVKQEKGGEFLRNPYGYPQPPSFPGYSDEWKKVLINETNKKFEKP